MANTGSVDVQRLSRQRSASLTESYERPAPTNEKIKQTTSVLYCDEVMPTEDYFTELEMSLRFERMLNIHPYYRHLNRSDFCEPFFPDKYSNVVFLKSDSLDGHVRYKTVNYDPGCREAVMEMNDFQEDVLTGKIKIPKGSKAIFCTCFSGDTFCGELGNVEIGPFIEMEPIDLITIYNRWGEDVFEKSLLRDDHFSLEVYRNVFMKVLDFEGLENNDDENADLIIACDILILLADMCNHYFKGAEVLTGEMIRKIKKERFHLFPDYLKEHLEGLIETRRVRAAIKIQKWYSERKV